MNISMLTNLNDMLQSLLFVVFVNGVLTPKRSRFLTSLIFVAAVSGSFLLTIPIRQTMKPVLMISVIIAAVYFLYKDTMKKKLIVAGMLLAFALFSEGLGVLLFMVISNFNFSLLLDFSIQRYIASVLFNMVFVMLSMTASLYINKFHGRVRRYMILFLAGLPVTYIALVMALFFNKHTEMTEDILLFATLSMIISIVSDLVTFLIVKTQKSILIAEKSAALMNIQHDLDDKYYTLALEESQKAARVKHDVLNQLQTIYSLFLSGDARQNKAGMEMVESLKSRLEDIQETIYCENRIINVILTLKIQEARKKGIDPVVSISVPKEIQIENMDLCSIFGNLLDNAIEACERVGSCGKLEIKAGIKLEYLVIKVTNSCDRIEKDEEGELVSLKEIKEGHGIGLKIIRDIVKKVQREFRVRNKRKGVHFHRHIASEQLKNINYVYFEHHLRPPS